MSTHFKFIKLISLSLILIIPFAIISGCGKYASKEDVVAYVNKDPIYASDLKKAIAMRARLDPSFKITPQTERDELDIIINRKLIVQEAMEKGLAREDRFVNTIKAFWEQTLVRDFVDFKKKQFQDYLFATDEEIKEYYANLSDKVTFKALKPRDRPGAEEAYRKYLKDKDTSQWETIGPVGYGDIISGVLLDVFEMGEGEAKILSDGTDVYVVEIVVKEKTAVEPLENLKGEIEKRIIFMKERRLFEDWLKEKKKRSRIRINRGNL